MEYLKIDGGFPRIENCAVTLGKFDGIHRGHRKLISGILGKKEEGATAVVCAFTSAGDTIFTSRERRDILEGLGVDVLLECPLDDRLRHMRAEAFVREILVGDLQASYVAVGEDFRFGYERKGTPELLRELGKKYGFETEVLSKERDGRRKISSTYIREELRKGNIQKVNELLGTPYFVEGTVEHGRGMGHRMFFPTANLVPSGEKLLPPNGVYAAVFLYEGRAVPGVTNIGYKPTVGERFVGVETYLFDCDRDLYGCQCRVEFRKFLRPERKFGSFDELKEQISRDIENSRAFFEKNPVDK